MTEIKIPKIELIPIGDLKTDGNNPNKMTPQQEEALEKSMLRYGVLKPAITNKNLLIADGEHGVKIAKRLGLKEYPTLRLDVDEVDRRMLRQIMNKLHGEHLPELDEAEFKFFLEQGRGEELQDLIGFNDKKLVQFFATVEKDLPGEDDLDIEGALEKPKYEVKTGDVWKLGEHKLICGDCTDEQYVTKLMFDELADMVFTDPPYGVDYASKNDFLNSIDKGNRIQTPMENDAIEDYNKFSGSWLQVMKYHLAIKNSVYICTSYSKLFDLLEQFKQKEFYFSQLLVWVKNNHVLGRSDYANKHELILYGWLGKHEYYGNFDTTVWEIDRPLKSELHPTMKPIELCSRAIKNSSKPREIVLDLFGGSGSTLIACEELDRKCRMMEIDPKYCSVIIERWEKLTEQKGEKLE